MQEALMKAMEAHEGGGRVARSSAWDKKVAAVGGNPRPGGRGPPPGRHSNGPGGRDGRGGPPPPRHSSGMRGGDGGGGKGRDAGPRRASSTSGKGQADIPADNVGAHLLNQPWTWWYSEYPKAKKAGNWNEHAQVQLSCMG